MHVVVVGGGFGGVKAALELSKRQVGKITLISDESYFLHHATLYATATGRSMAESVIPLNTIFAHHPSVEIVKDRITDFDPRRNMIRSKKKSYHYDKLVLALGSVTTYFGISGMAEHSYGIKSLEDIKEFHSHIHTEVVTKQLDKEYFVIGAGPTGIELAGALNAYLQDLKSLNRIKNMRSKITLVEAAPQVVPRMSKSAARKISNRLKKVGISVLTNHKVEALSEDTITIEGKKRKTKTAVWTSGVANSPFFTENAALFNLAPNGRVIVEPTLAALKDVYVVGDNNTVKYSGMALPAMQQAKHAAKNIARSITGRPEKKFRPRSVPTGLPIGEDWSYVEWFGLYAAGRTGKVIRRWMELYGYCQLVPFKTAVAIWRAHDIPEIDV